MATSFVYFSSGKDFLHNRGIFSILSLVCNYSLKADERIIVFTDQPQYYEKFLSELPIDYQMLDSNDIQKLMGNDNLIHRVKIGIIEKSTQLYPQHNILYVDTDTFFFQNFTEILTKISPQTSIMHKFEYPMTFLGTYPPNDADHFRDVYDFLKSNQFTIKGVTQYILPESFASWNAGIIGLHPTHFECLTEVYEFTDQLYSYARNHACEQYAFSYFLQKRTKLIDCEQYNRHYWHRIEKKIVDEFLAKKLNNYFATLPLEEKKTLVNQWAKYLLMKIPKHEYMLRYNAMIAFQEKRYLKGYKEAIRTLLANPLQDFTFFKDVAYYTKKMLLSK